MNVLKVSLFVQSVWRKQSAGHTDGTSISTWNGWSGLSWGRNMTSRFSSCCSEDHETTPLDHLQGRAEGRSESSKGSPRYCHARAACQPEKLHPWSSLVVILCLLPARGNGSWSYRELVSFQKPQRTTNSVLISSNSSLPFTEHSAHLCFRHSKCWETIS